MKLRRLEGWNEMRRRTAALYAELLRDLDEVDLPNEPPGCRHVYNQFTIMARRRGELRHYLEEKGISTMIYYPLALHLQPVFSHLGYRRGDFPVAEKTQEQVLSLPICPGLTEENVRAVAEAIRGFYRERVS